MDSEILTDSGFMSYGQIRAVVDAKQLAVELVHAPSAPVVYAASAPLKQTHAELCAELNDMFTLTRTSRRAVALSLDIGLSSIGIFFNKPGPTAKLGAAARDKIAAKLRQWLAGRRAKISGPGASDVQSQTMPLRAGLRVATLDPAKGALVYVDATALIHNVGRQPSVSFTAGAGVDAVVTAEHTLYVSPAYCPVDASGAPCGGLVRDQPYSRLPASVLLKTPAFLDGKMNAWRFQCAAEAGAVQADFDLSVLDLSLVDDDTFLSLFGFWLGDGSICVCRSKGHEYRYVEFTQSKPQGKAFLNACFQRAGLATTESIEHFDDGRLPKSKFRLKSRIWADVFWTWYASHYSAELPPADATDSTEEVWIASAKWLLWWVWLLSKRQARVLLDGLREADSAADGQPVIHTASARFREELIRLCLHAGYSAVAAVSHDPDYQCVVNATGQLVTSVNGLYRVNYADRSAQAQPTLELAHNAVTAGHVDESWCVSVPPHATILVRRPTDEGLHSRPVWMGNCLGQNFAKMFDIQFESKAGSREHVWQNSWGLTTRTIGVMVMVHGDDKGLVLPPAVAPQQVVLVPIYKKDNMQQLDTAMDELAKRLRAIRVRTEVDKRDNYNPGWKFAHWEVKGVPLRIEVGLQEVEKRVIKVQRRDKLDKADSLTLQWDELEVRVPQILAEMQADMLRRATEERDSRRKQVTEWKDFLRALDGRNTALAPHCEQMECEKSIKVRTGEAAKAEEQQQQEEDDGEKEPTDKNVEKLTGAAKTLCIPFQQPELPAGTKCIGGCGSAAKNWTLFGRSY